VEAYTQADVVVALAGWDENSATCIWGLIESC
jgi:hypothetical protein